MEGSARQALAAQDQDVELGAAALLAGVGGDRDHVAGALDGQLAHRLGLFLLSWNPTLQ